MKNQLYKHIASLIQAIESCERSGNVEWNEKHRVTLEQLGKNHLPSGSGIDNGVWIDRSNSTPDKLIFEFAFHHMNDAGMYCGWTDHFAIVTPSLSLLYNFHIEFTGMELEVEKYWDEENDKPLSVTVEDDLGDYLHNIFSHALETEVDV